METITTEKTCGIYSKEAPKFTVKGYGASGSLIGGKTLEPMDIDRNEPAADEVLIEVLYCGVCHSDLHQVNNDWKNTIYPCVPGHEVIGRVAGVGTAVTRFALGDIVGVGCMIDSCQHCKPCQSGHEQYCQGENGATMTYNGYMKPANPDTKFNTFGGYSTHIVAKENFVLVIPDKLNIESAAPILCAGVTTYAPLKRWGVKPGDKVAVVGIGGLGHMGVMLAKAMGAEVTAITTKEEKRSDAMELGADQVIVSVNDDEMKAAERMFDYILITIPYPFDINQYTCLLNTFGSLVTVGLLGPYEKPLDNNELAMQGRSVGGSVIGGIGDTQEVLDFCAEHGIAPHTQMIEIKDINDALDKVKDEDVRFRYVIDMQSLK